MEFIKKVNNELKTKSSESTFVRLFKIYADMF